MENDEKYTIKYELTIDPSSEKSIIRFVLKSLGASFRFFWAVIKMAKDVTIATIKRHYYAKKLEKLLRRTKWHDEL
jgi:hypothetical protein